MMIAYKLVKHFGCYVGDMESCIEMDAESWQDYIDDPRPYLRDLLGDFSDREVLRDEFDIDLEDSTHWKANSDKFDALIEQALDEYCGVRV